jgi:transposase InsO family protein
MALSAEYAVQVVCRALDYARSSFYYAPQEPSRAAFEAELKRVAGEWPTYGYRRLTQQLKRELHQAINSKRVRRSMRILGLQGRVKRKKRQTTYSEHPFPRYPNLVSGLAITFPDQVWVSDITYVHLHSEFVYLAVVMDVFTRSIRGWFLSRQLDQELTLTALRRALQDRVGQIHHSDQGVQYAATAYTDLLQAHEVQISMAEVGQAWQNGYAERLMKTIKEEQVDLSDYQDYWDAYHQIARFLEDVYMRKRIHSSLGYLTPVEFEQHWLTQQIVKVPCSLT